MSEESIIRRRRLDHERYLRHREERKRCQREYYFAHKDEILAAVRLKRLGLYVRPQPSEKSRERAKERKKEYDRAYYWAHRERILQKAREKREEKINSAK